MERDISSAVIRRLPRYYRYLDELMESGVERISSGELSRRMNLTASQIRQDLNNFGGFGQQGYGYNIKYLYGEIGKILGIDKENTMIIIGGGNLGRALANYGNFEKRGFVVIGIFDNSSEIIGQQVKNLTVQDTATLPEFLKNHKVDIVTLAIPKTAAPKIAEELVDMGVKAFGILPIQIYIYQRML